MKDTIADLRRFREKRKFSCIEPEFAYLAPSPAAVTNPLILELNKCATNLEQMVNNGATKTQLKGCLSKSLNSLDKPFDTEDREYLCFYYQELGGIVGVSMGSTLNRWLYGFPLGYLVGLIKGG